jgi:hypothetical protein
MRVPSTIVFPQLRQHSSFGNLISLRRPLRHGELSRSTGKSLGANLVDCQHSKYSSKSTSEHTNEVLARRRVALVGRQPVEEVLHVASVVVDGTRSNEAVHLHRAVVPLPEFPGAVADVEVALRFTDGVDVAESAEPVDKRLKRVKGYNVVAGPTKP